MRITNTNMRIELRSSNCLLILMRLTSKLRTLNCFHQIINVITRGCGPIVLRLRIRATIRSTRTYRTLLSFFINNATRVNRYRNNGAVLSISTSKGARLGVISTNIEHRRISRSFAISSTSVLNVRITFITQMNVNNSTQLCINLRFRSFI